jgi:cell division protein FtsL
MPEVTPFRRRRTMTTLAVGLLLLDGALLLIAAFWAKNLVLGLLGGLFVLLAAGVVVYWRRYRQALADVERASAELKEQAQELRRLIQQRKAE